MDSLLILVMDRWMDGILCGWTNGLINGYNVHGKIDGHLNNGYID